MIKYVVLDIEVDADTKRRRFCDPLEQENTIVMVQRKYPDKPVKINYNEEGISRDINLELESCDVIVGHNIKFDLLYLWNNPSLQQFLKRGGKIWDTCIVEYYLNGQNKDLKYNLSTVSERYGGKKKLDIVEEHFKAGKYFSELDKDVAHEYGAMDVINTERIFNTQKDSVYLKNIEKMIAIQMNHLIALCEIENNGMYINKNQLQKSLQECKDNIDTSLQSIDWYVKETDWPSDKVAFDPNSTQHVSAILYGGEVKYFDQVFNPHPTAGAYYLTGVRKGELRTANKKVSKHIVGLQLPKGEPLKTKGYYSVDDKTLKTFNHKFVSMLIAYRQQYKLYSTYLYPAQELIHPTTGCIHSEFLQKTTVTTRLSSRNPNFQNLHPKYLQCFSSRFGNEGRLIELDFSQMEIRVLAYLSGDKTLLKEVKKGESIYLNTMDYIRQDPKGTATKRDTEYKMFKALVLGLTYGKGYKSMAVGINRSEEFCEEFINKFYEKYRGVYLWHKSIVKEVRESVVKSIGHLQCGASQPIFTFHEKEYRGRMSVTPTQIKNYPVQGLAALLQAFVVSNVKKYLDNYKNALLVNEIHDSIIVDCTKNVVEEVKDNIIQIMRTPPSYLNFNVPIDVDYVIGHNWEEIKKNG